MGLDGHIVYGETGQTELYGTRHNWNLVRWADQLYVVDCTWDDPLPDREEQEPVSTLYFLRSVQQLHATHKPYFLSPAGLAEKDEVTLAKNSGRFLRQLEDLPHALAELQRSLPKQAKAGKRILKKSFYIASAVGQSSSEEAALSAKAIEAVFRSFLSQYGLTGGWTWRYRLQSPWVEFYLERRQAAPKN